MFHEFSVDIFFFLPPRSSWTIVSCTPTEACWFAPSTHLTLAFISVWLKSTHTSPALLSGSRCSSSLTDNWTQGLELPRTSRGSAAMASNPASTTRTTWERWARHSTLWRSTATRCGWRRGRQGAEGVGWEVANGNTCRKWRRVETGGTTEKSGGTNQNKTACWGQPSRKGRRCEGCRCDREL